jgi:hypothetical protein
MKLPKPVVVCRFFNVHGALTGIRYVSRNRHNAHDLVFLLFYIYDTLELEDVQLMEDESALLFHDDEDVSISQSNYASVAEMSDQDQASPP